MLKNVSKPFEIILITKINKKNRLYISSFKTSKKNYSFYHKILRPVPDPAPGPFLVKISIGFPFFYFQIKIISFKGKFAIWARVQAENLF
jgi:hypothetical protein